MIIIKKIYLTPVAIYWFYERVITETFPGPRLFVAGLILTIISGYPFLYFFSSSETFTKLKTFINKLLISNIYLIYRSLDTLELTIHLLFFILKEQIGFHN